MDGFQQHVPLGAHCGGVPVYQEPQADGSVYRQNVSPQYFECRNFPRLQEPTQCLNEEFFWFLDLGPCLVDWVR